jgi:hypothetical protein
MAPARGGSYDRSMLLSEQSDLPATGALGRRLPLVLPARLPCPIGKSPFHIKGSAYAGIRSYQVKAVPRGLQGVLDSIEDPELRAFASQRFYANEWYDYLPALLIARAAAASASKPPEVFIGEVAVRHAEGDLRGIYRMLLLFTSPETAMRRMAMVHRQYFDFGRVQVRIVRDGEAESTLSGLPAIAAPFYALYLSEFVHRLLVLAGAKDPVGIWEDPVRDGELEGIPTVTLRARTLWRR